MKTIKRNEEVTNSKNDSDIRRGPGRPRNKDSATVTNESESTGTVAKAGLSRESQTVAESKPADPQFDEMEANALLDLLQNIEQPLAAKIYGIPFEITRQAFVFSEDMRKRINPPMIRLLNKWGPSIIKVWKDEIGFIMVFGSALSMQVREMHHLESKRKKEVASPITPIRPEVAKPAEPKLEPKPEPQSGIKLTGKETVDLDKVGSALL